MEFISGCSTPIDLAHTSAGLGNAAATRRNGSTATPGRCPQCACPDAQKIVSRHLTTEGLLTYARCRCGALHLWLWPHDAGAAQHIARSRQAG